MYYLAFETAFGKFSISLFREGKPVDNYVCTNENEQAELLLPAVEEVLARNNIKYADLDYIAVGIGPGSFTGVRIGLAAAKGMALATGAELIGVTSLEAAAYDQGGGKIYLNAQRGQAYYQEFDKDINPLHEPELVFWEGPFSPLPDAASIGYVACKKLLNPHFTTEPLYIRKPDAKFRLRQAAEKDISWLAETHAASFSNKWNEQVITASLKSGAAIIADRLGFLFYEIIGDECEIKSIATLPHARRNGVASFMWQQLLKDCAEKNVKKIFLEVETGNEAAVKFYQKLGFDIVSTRRNYYGEGRDAIIMLLEETNRGSGNTAKG